MSAPGSTSGAGRPVNSSIRFDRPMADPNQWAFPSSLQPRAVDLRFDLAAAMNAVVALRAEVPEDAFTASILGTERTGNGVVIGDDGLVLTVGYLITEAETIWLTSNDGRVVPATPLAYDFASGLGLVQPLAPLDLPPLALAQPGALAALDEGSEVYALGHGGRAHALAARVFAKREFAGYWEYLLDEALFTRPPHPEWSGAALVDDEGRLVGLGSLFVQERDGDDEIKGNMFIPVELLAPILDELRRYGARRAPARPWLGIYTAEDEGRLIVQGVATGGPAERAGVRPGDVVVEASGVRVATLPEFYRAVWRSGSAGVAVPLVLTRGGASRTVELGSADRESFLKKPRLQ